MEDVIINEISNMLQPLANKLGENGRFIWQVQVKQTNVDAIMSVISILIFTVFLIASIKMFRRVLLANDLHAKGMKVTWIKYSKVICVVSLCVSFISLYIIYSDIYNLLTIIYNPEYHALKGLLLTIQGNTKL